MWRGWSSLTNSALTTMSSGCITRCVCQKKRCEIIWSRRPSSSCSPPRFWSPQSNTWVCIEFQLLLMYCVDVLMFRKEKANLWRNKFTQATQLTALSGTVCPPTWWTPTVGSIPLSRNQSMKHFEQNQHTFLWIIDVCFVGWRAKWSPRLAKMLHTLELPPRMATRRISSEPQHNSHPSLFPRKSIVSLSTLF